MEMMMMQPEMFEISSWPEEYINVINPSDFIDMDFSSSFTNIPEDFSDISSLNLPYFSTDFSGEFRQSPASSDDEFQFMPAVEDYIVDSINSSDEMESANTDEWSPSPSPSIKSSEASMEAAPSSLTFPGGKSLELDNQLIVFHLLKAYGEAMERGEIELAAVIMKSVSEKVSPAGEILERLAFNLTQDHEKQQGDYLRQESFKNFEAAFMAFYQIFPYGKFAHFSANSAIVAAIPADAEAVHIVDFDIGEGVQWPPVIEALAKTNLAVRLTAIKWDDTLVWNFDEAKIRLVDHAKSFGLKLKIEEMGIEELVNEIKRTKKRGGRKEFLVFNSMVGLPHMGRVRSKTLVNEFFQVAKGLSANFITSADGEFGGNPKNCSDFGSFFDGNLVHYQALLESMTSNFPAHLGEARMAMESLFIAPFASSHGWFQRWMEMRELGCDVEVGNGFEGWIVSREILEEAKEMVKEKQSSFSVRIGGQWQNDLILEWKRNPLVRVSTWKN